MNEKENPAARPGAERGEQSEQQADHTASNQPAHRKRSPDIRDGKTLAIFERGSSAQIRVTTSTYKGVQRLDFREWFFARDVGEFRPTRTGVSLLVEEATTLINALQAGLSLPAAVKQRREQPVRRRGGGPTPVQTAQLQQLEAEGKTVREIAAVMGVSAATVSRWRKAMS